MTLAAHVLRHRILNMRALAYGRRSPPHLRAQLRERLAELETQARERGLDVSGWRVYPRGDVLGAVHIGSDLELIEDRAVPDPAQALDRLMLEIEDRMSAFSRPNKQRTVATPRARCSCSIRLCVIARRNN